MPDWTRDMTRHIALPLLCLAWSVMAWTERAHADYRLLIDGEDCGGIDVTVPMVVERNGDILLDTIDGVQCGVVGPPCGPPAGFRVLDQVSVELNNFPGPSGSTFAEVFGPYPGDGGFYRIRLNALDVVSLPVTVPDAPEVVRLLFEGNTDIASATTVALSACDGGPPVSPTCGKVFGESGTTFIFGAAAVEQRCKVPPGDYWLVILQADEAGNPTCGGDQLCTVFFGLDSLIGGDP